MDVENVTLCQVQEMEATVQGNENHKETDRQDTTYVPVGSGVGAAAHVEAPPATGAKEFPATPLSASQWAQRRERTRRVAEKFQKQREAKLEEAISLGKGFLTDMQEDRIVTAAKRARRDPERLLKIMDKKAYDLCCANPGASLEMLLRTIDDSVDQLVETLGQAAEDILVLPEGHEDEQDKSDLADAQRTLAAAARDRVEKSKDGASRIEIPEPPDGRTLRSSHPMRINGMLAWWAT